MREQKSLLNIKACKPALVVKKNTSPLSAVNLSVTNYLADSDFTYKNVMADKINRHAEIKLTKEI